MTKDGTGKDKPKKPTPRKKATHLKLVKGEKDAPKKRSDAAPAEKAGSKERSSSKKSSKRSSSGRRVGPTGAGLFAALFTVAILIIAAVALYGPTKEYYIAMREGQRLELELEQRQQRNAEREAAVQSLQTEEGIEDEARRKLGFVKEGEEAGAVTGIEEETDTAVLDPADEPEIEAPRTWWSPLLDRLFGVSDE